MSELEKEIEKAYKLIEEAASPLCFSLVLHKIKLQQIKNSHKKLLDAILILEDIVGKIQNRI